MYAAEEQWSALLDRGGPVDFFGSRMVVPQQRRFGDLAAIRRYVDHVLGLAEVRAAHPDAGPVTVRERAGQRRAHYEPASATIAIPLREAWAARESVVLHEVAHHLACSLSVGPGDPARSDPRQRADWHGATFRQAMCGLVAAVLGPEAALLLRTGYEEAGLRTVAAS